MKVTTDIEQIFEPLLRQFCKATEPIEIGEDFSSVFIPHTMCDYSKADRRIFISAETHTVGNLRVN